MIGSTPQPVHRLSASAAPFYRRDVRLRFRAEGTLRPFLSTPRDSCVCGKLGEEMAVCFVS